MSRETVPRQPLHLLFGGEPTGLHGVVRLHLLLEPDAADASPSR